MVQGGGWCSGFREWMSPELDLALGGEVDLVEGRVEVLRERLEEVRVFIVRHVRGRAHLRVSCQHR